MSVPNWAGGAGGLPPPNAIPASKMNLKKPGMHTFVTETGQTVYYEVPVPNPFGGNAPAGGRSGPVPISNQYGGMPQMGAPPQYGPMGMGGMMGGGMSGMNGMGGGMMCGMGGGMMGPCMPQMGAPQPTDAAPGPRDGSGGGRSEMYR